MFRRELLRSLVIGVGVVALQLFSAGSAYAYSLTVSANAVCTNGVAVINYTAGSWGTHVGASNTQVNVLFDGAVVDSQPFVVPTNSFSGSKPAPLNATTVTVTAIGAGTWGDGFTGTGVPASVVVTIPTNCVEVADFGRFTGGPNTVDVGGASVTAGLQIHCHQLKSNNFEINWGNGNKFHMADVQTVTCFDSPIVTPQPPRAPIDTMVAVGFGRYNNVDGYTIEFTLVDSGEPGKKNLDMAGMLIYRTANPAEVVLNVPLQIITGGNLQAHYDQPHGGNGNK